MSPAPLRLGIVGPCSAGKTTLISRLKELGYDARHIAQEHSYVPYMWQRISHPDYLIYLDVSFPVSNARRKLDWDETEFEQQHLRLRHAREHADIYIDTDPLTPQEVLERVLTFLNL
jgi:deoxyadenosine/deoxycytidine kinase